MCPTGWASDLGRVGPSEGALEKPKECQRGEQWRARQGWAWEVEFWGSNLGRLQKKKEVSALPVFSQKAPLSTCTNLYSLGCPEVKQDDTVPPGGPRPLHSHWPPRGRGVDTEGWGGVKKSGLREFLGVLGKQGSLSLPSLSLSLQKLVNNYCGHLRPKGR